MNRLRCLILIAVVILATPVDAIEGIAISLHLDGAGATEKLDDVAKRATLMRYEIRDGKVVGARALCDEGAGAACISPAGDRVAFVKIDGTLCVVGIEGGVVVEVGKVQGATSGGLQWPASEGGQWIYYVAGGGEDTLLRRVHVQRKADEAVVRFDRAVKGAFALSPDAKVDFGRFLTASEDGVLVYDLARGDGDLFNCMRVAGGGGASVSPDGSLFTAYDGRAGVLGLLDSNGAAAGGDAAEGG